MTTLAYLRLVALRAHTGSSYTARRRAPRRVIDPGISSFARESWLQRAHRTQSAGHHLTQAFSAACVSFAAVTRPVGKTVLHRDDEEMTPLLNECGCFPMPDAVNNCLRLRSALDLSRDYSEEAVNVSSWPIYPVDAGTA